MREEIEELINFFLQQLRPLAEVYLMKKEKNMKSLEKEVKNCCKCSLHKERKNIVFGDGDPETFLMFIGEAPGREEDEKGLPFVGDAGKLLERIISAMGLERKNLYITNVVKCRPPHNRDPLPSEIESCLPYLRRQIEFIKPKIIVTLGRHAGIALFGKGFSLTHSRGNFLEYQGIKVMPTFHPAYLLRNPKAKVLVWEDMKKVLKELGLKPAGR